MQDDQVSDVVTEQWISRHGITIPRAAGVFQSPTGWVKIDGRGTIIAAGERDQTVLAWLVERNTLSYADVDYGIAYVTCRSADRAYRRQMGYKSSLDLSVLSGGGGLSCEQAAQVFSLVRASLGREDCGVIEYACDTVRIPDAPTNYKPNYRRAFTALAKAFDKAAKDVREGTVSDEPQPRIEKSLALRIDS
jgi:hypothetical protein